MNSVKMNDRRTGFGMLIKSLTLRRLKWFDHVICIREPLVISTVHCKTILLREDPGDDH